MESVLLVVHIIVCVALVGVILLQQNSSDGLSGIGGGGSSGLMSSRGSANFLTRLTAILATIFIVNSLVLAVIASHSKRGASPVESILPTGEKAAPASAPKAAKDTKAKVPLAK